MVGVLSSVKFTQNKSIAGSNWFYFRKSLKALFKSESDLTIRIFINCTQSLCTHLLEKNKKNFLKENCIF